MTDGYIMDAVEAAGWDDLGDVYLWEQSRVAVMVLISLWNAGAWRQ